MCVCVRVCACRIRSGVGRILVRRYTPYWDARNVTLLGMQIAFHRRIIILGGSQQYALGSYPATRQLTDIGRSAVWPKTNCQPIRVYTLLAYT